VLTAPHSPDEVKTLLQAETGLFWGKHVLRGIQRGDTLVLRMRRLFFHNAFETVAAVKAVPGFRGSQVNVTLRSSYWIAGFITFWLGFAIVVGATVVVSALGTSAAGGALVTSSILPIGGFGFMALGRALAFGDRAKLLDFNRQTTAAEDLPPGLESSIPNF
jgi:hypothetical protein